MPLTQSQNRKRILQAAIAAAALLTLSCMLRIIAAQECHLLHNLIWAALQLSRPAILAVATSAPAHPCHASTLLQQLLEIVASNWPLPHTLLG
jgi:hypothetical protein